MYRTIRKEAEIFCGPFLRTGKVLAHVARNQNVEDLTAHCIAEESRPVSPHSGRDCVKSLCSSYTGLYHWNPQKECRGRGGEVLGNLHYAADLDVETLPLQSDPIDARLVRAVVFLHENRERPDLVRHLLFIRAAVMTEGSTNTVGRDESVVYLQRWDQRSAGQRCENSVVLGIQPHVG